MRHISQIRDLPLSQLSDEEIVKAARHRLSAKFAMLVYLDEEGKHLMFLGNYKDKQGRGVYGMCIQAWQEKFGKIKLLKNKTGEQ